MTKEVATAPIKPLFAPTGWKTAALEHISFQVPDYRKEAAFYIALMGWKLRSDDGKQAILDIGDWGIGHLQGCAARTDIGPGGRLRLRHRSLERPRPSRRNSASAISIR